jgi:hypothetical protein
MADGEDVFDCAACGDILTVGELHECPVTGTIHSIVPADGSSEELDPFGTSGGSRTY